MHNTKIENKHSILHFCSYTWETGGPPNVIYNHSRFLLENNWDVHIASSICKSNNIYSKLLGLKVFVFRKNFISILFKDFSFKMLIWYLKNRNIYSVVNVHGLWNLGSILPFYFKNKSLKIITVHGFLDSYVMKDSMLLKKLFWYFFQKKCFEKADIIHAISENEYNNLVNIFPDFIDKIFLIPNGLYAPNLFNEINFKFKSNLDAFIKNDDFVFLFLSRINKKKGLDILVPAFNKLLFDYPNIKLIIAGPKGDFSNELLHITSGNSNILLLPSCIDWSKNYLFQRSDVFVLPSYSEGFSIAALEAISYGIPSIFSNFIGFSVDVANFKAGLISDTTISSLYEQMKILYNNDDVRKEISLNSKHLFNSKFKMDIIGSIFLSKINNLLYE